MYSQEEFSSLDTISMVTDDPDDKYGFDTVCECGSKFHSDKWHIVEKVETSEGEIEVSTVALSVAHGWKSDLWYETCVFIEGGSRVVDSFSRVVDRYMTEDEAIHGHAEYMEKIENGEFSLSHTEYGISIEFDW